MKIVHRLVEVLGASSSSTIFLTSRSFSNAEKAVNSLKLDLIASQIEVKLKIIPQALDIADKVSVASLKTKIESEYNNRIDVLINNAGIAYSMSDATPFAEQARHTVDVNYYGTKRMIFSFLPALRNSVLADGGRVVNVSSSLGILRGSEVSDDIQQRLLKAEATASDVDAVMESFVAAATEGMHRELGYWKSAYGASKTGVTQLTRVLVAAEKNREQHSLAQRHKSSNSSGTDSEGGEDARCVRMFACCPGFCRTDMTRRGWNWSDISLRHVMYWLSTWVKGHSAYAGADTPAWLAVGDVPCGREGETGDDYNGKFIKDRLVKSY